MSEETLTFLDACAIIALYDYDNMKWKELVQFITKDINRALNTVLGIDITKVDSWAVKHVLNVKREIREQFMEVPA